MTRLGFESLPLVLWADMTRLGIESLPLVRVPVLIRPGIVSLPLVLEPVMTQPGIEYFPLMLGTDVLNAQWINVTNKLMITYKQMQISVFRSFVNTSRSHFVFVFPLFQTADIRPNNTN